MGLSLNTDQTLVTEKDAGDNCDVDKMPRAHRYNFLKVNEVSIVTEPAILSQEEADKGVGFPIVKFVEDVDLTTLSTSAGTLKVSDEASTEPLVKAAIDFIVESVKSAETMSLVPVKVTDDTIVLTEPYKKPLDNAALFFKMVYKQDEVGNFTFFRPKKFEVTFNDNSIEASKVYEIVKELPMSQITGVEVGGTVIKVTPIPGIEFESADGELIFRCGEDGVLTTGDEYSIDDDGVVRKTSEIAVAVEAPEVESETDATKFYLTLEQVQTLMATSGDSYSFKMGPDGAVSLAQVIEKNPVPEVAAVTEVAEAVEAVEPAASPEKEVEQASATAGEADDLALRIKRLEEELAKTKQKVAGSSTTDPEVAENASKSWMGSTFPRDKEHRPVDGNYQRGIFTRHIDKSLLDRGSRLQADLISG